MELSTIRYVMLEYWAICLIVLINVVSNLMKVMMKSVTIQAKITEQYFPVVLCIMLYKVVLAFESVDNILKCEHSNESY